MTAEERIQIRDKIIECIKVLNLVKENSQGWLKALGGRSRLEREISSNIKLKKLYDLYIEQFRTKEEAQYCLLHSTDISEYLCPICNNPRKFYNFAHGYRDSCKSEQCMKILLSTEESKKKRKATNIKRHGYDNPFSEEGFCEKRKQINLERHGDECPLRLEKFKQKRIDTVNKKYGCDYITQTQIFKDKRKESLMNNYHVDSPLQSPIIQERFKKTMIKRHHVESAMHSKELMKKRDETNIRLYGHKCVLQNPEVRRKAEQTMILKYGTKYGMKCAAILQKMYDTMIKRYGTKYLLQNKDIKIKKDHTCELRFGTKNPMQNDEVKKKQHETNIKKYGFKMPAQNKNIQDKMKETNNRIYGVNYISQKNVKHYDIWSDKNKFKQFIIDKYNEKETFLTLSEINGFFEVCTQSLKKHLELYDLLDYFYIQDSNLEIDFDSFLNAHKIEHIRFYRKMLDLKTNTPREIDFLCGNIGFEINDITSHNSLNPKANSYKDPSYHLNKTELAAQNGIRLIHVWEWEIRNSLLWDKLIRWITNFFNEKKIRLSVDECSIRRVDKNEERSFLNKYHFQGYQKSEVCFGLYYNDELVQLMSFSKIREDELELLRFCMKFGYSIEIDETYKLLKNFIDKYNPQKIIAYCNFDKFTGKTYEELEFRLTDKIPPQVIWCDKDMNYFTQSELDSNGARKILGVESCKDMSDEDIVKLFGYVPVYNCGLGVYTMNI